MSAFQIAKIQFDISSNIKLSHDLRLVENVSYQNIATNHMRFHLIYHPTNNVPIHHNHFWKTTNHMITPWNNSPLSEIIDSAMAMKTLISNDMDTTRFWTNQKGISFHFVDI